VNLAELELIHLANEHLEEEIEGLRRLTNQRMALPQDRQRIKPITDKIWRLDSILNIKLNFLESTQNMDSIKNELIGLSSIMLLHNDIDTLDAIQFNNQTYDDSNKTYRYENLKLELLNRELELATFLNNLKEPSPSEWKEIRALCRSNTLLIQKKTLEYLSQRLAVLHQSLFSNQTFISVDYNKRVYKPNEVFSFDVFTSAPYLKDLTLSEYTFDDSVVVNKASFHEYDIEFIQVPTSSVGMHKIEIKQYLGGHKKTPNYMYNYEVIEK
jgi:hypothetical protein